MKLTRRQLIKTGLVGGGVLALTGYMGKGIFWGAGSKPAVVAGEELQHLTGEDVKMLQAVVPVVLEGAITGSAQEREALVWEVIGDLDLVFDGMIPGVYKEAGQLFTLLKLAPARWITTGIGSWEKASGDDVRAWLDRWQHSNKTLYQTAYDAIQQMIMGAWYGNPKSWPRVGYPGPPELIAQGGTP